MPLCPFCHIKLKSSADVRRHQQQAISCFKENQKVFGNALKAKRKRRTHPASDESNPPAQPDPVAGPSGTVDNDVDMANLDESQLDEPLSEDMDTETMDVDAVAPRIVEVEDEDAPEVVKRRRWRESFPSAHETGATRGNQKTSFEKIRDEDVLTGAAVWGPFRDEEEWELAKWLIKNVGHSQADHFPKLPIVSLMPFLHENIHIHTTR